MTVIKNLSVVLAPGVPTNRAPEEPDLALISGTELAEPPECKVVFALGAFDRDGRQGLDLPLLDDHDLLFAPFSRLLELVFFSDLPDVPAFPAFELASRGYHQTFALRTEHWFNHLGPFMIKALYNVEQACNGVKCAPWKPFF